MNNLSMVQALSLWTDLEQALHGTNGYGGHTAEIYWYRMLSGKSPYTLAVSEPPKDGIVFEIQRDAHRRVAQSLISLLKHFAVTHPGVSMWIDGIPLSKLKMKEMEIHHRVHVKITSKRKLMGRIESAANKLSRKPSKRY